MLFALDLSQKKDRSFSLAVRQDIQQKSDSPSANLAKPKIKVAAAVEHRLNFAEILYLQDNLAKEFWEVKSNLFELHSLSA